MLWCENIAKEFLNKDKVVCASGVTPSGLKHIGSLREVITPYFVVKSLKKLNKKVDFLFFWDSYDRFRKVPAGAPKEYEMYLGRPISNVPDPFGCHKSWAHHWMEMFEKELSKLDIKPKYIYQHELYNKCFYADKIKIALNKKDLIINILNKYRNQQLSSNWWPAIIYCEKCGKDTTEIIEYDGNYKIKYKCECGYNNSFSFKEKGIIKLKWRVDWPMRWSFYGVDFEPAGKDHMVYGGSYTTGKEIVKLVFDGQAPRSVLADFVGIKGGPSKLSASSGNVYTISDVLRVYLPEIIKYIFVGKPNKEIKISFDEDVIKIYNDFYKCELAYYGEADNLSEKKIENYKSMYELCTTPRKTRPPQLDFRVAVIISQVFPEDEWVDKAKEYLKTKDSYRLKEIIKRAKFWLENFAPEKYKIIINDTPPQIKLRADIVDALKELGKFLLTNPSKEEVKNKIIELSNMVGVKEFFKSAYQVILSRDEGPRLLNLIESVGHKRIANLLLSL